MKTAPKTKRNMYENLSLSNFSTVFGCDERMVPTMAIITIEALRKIGRQVIIPLVP